MCILPAMYVAFPAPFRWVRDRIPATISVHIPGGKEKPKPVLAPPLTIPSKSIQASACDVHSDYSQALVKLDGVNPFLFGRTLAEMVLNGGDGLSCKGPFPLVGCSVAAVQGVPSGLSFVLRDGKLVRIDITAPTIEFLQNIHVSMYQGDALSLLGNNVKKGIDFSVAEPEIDRAVPSRQTIRLTGLNNFVTVGAYIVTDNATVVSEHVGLLTDTFPGSPCWGI